MDYVAQPQIGNRFLAMLPENEYKQLLPELEPVKMKSGDPIHQAYEPIEYVHFPVSCVVSQVTTLKDGTSTEAGVIGREGATGVPITLLNTTSPLPTHIQLPGYSLRMKTDSFRAALERGSAFDRLMRKFCFAYLSQVARVVSCNAHHKIEQRLARWILMCHDRAGRNDLPITQDFIAQMLGVHRPGVTIAAIALRDAGLIDYQRAVVIVQDRAGLEEVTCECYKEIYKEYAKYLDSFEL